MEKQVKYLAALGIILMVAFIAFVANVLGTSAGSSVAAPAYAGPSGQLDQLSELHSQDVVNFCARMDMPPSYSKSDVHIRIKPAQMGKLGPVRAIPLFVNSGTLHGKPKLVLSTTRQEFCSKYTAPKVLGRWKVVNVRLVVHHRLLDRYPLGIYKSP
jgi:hypothetical protein